MLNSPNVSMNAHALSHTNTTSNGVLLIHPRGGVAYSSCQLTRERELTSDNEHCWHQDLARWAGPQPQMC